MERQQQVEKLLTDILVLMDFPARLDFKDAVDGSLAVALHFTAEPPQGITAGKKSHLLDSLQFLLNKCINRPNAERRWVTLGVGGFPEPRGARPGQAAAPSSGAASPQVVGAPRAPSAPRQPPRPARGEVRAGQRGGAPKAAEPDEAQLEVAADPLLTALGTALAEKSAKLGRVYAVAMMSTEDRARLLKAAKAVPGASARVEGESHFRRLAFIPDKPTPMPKRHAMAVYPDDEEEGD